MKIIPVTQFGLELDALERTLLENAQTAAASHLSETDQELLKCILAGDTVTISELRKVSRELSYVFVEKTADQTAIRNAAALLGQAVKDIANETR